MYLLHARAALVMMLSANRACALRVKLSDDRGAHPLSRQDEKGRTALARCAGGGDNTCVRLLLQASADVDLADKDGISPLHYVREAAFCSS